MSLFALRMKKMHMTCILRVCVHQSLATAQKHAGVDMCASAYGSHSLLGVLDVLEDLAHQADLVHRVLHHNPQGRVVPRE